MSSLSIPLRQKLKENYSLTCLKMVDERVSQVDGTRKYLFGLEDGHVIESVWMQYHHGNSVCISSQVGCRMGVPFPGASTLDGLEREPASLRDAGTDIQDSVHHRGTCFQCSGHGIRGAYG